MTQTLQRPRRRKAPPRAYAAGSLLRDYRASVQAAYAMQRKDRFGEIGLPDEAYDAIRAAKDCVLNRLAARWRFAHMKHTGRILDVLSRHRRAIADSFPAA